jgi:hypothetical protein
MRMKKTLLILPILVALGLSGAHSNLSTASAQTILWVSDAPQSPGFHGPFDSAAWPDNGFITLLTNAGFNVHRFDPPDSQDTLLTPAQVAAINTNDLVIIGRTINSPAFQSPQGPQWNTQIIAPLITMSPYLVRPDGERFGWFTGGTLPDGQGTRVTAVNPEDMVTAYIFSSVELDAANTTIELYDEPIDRGTSHIVQPPVAGGVLRATTMAGATLANVIATFPTGTSVRNGQDVLAGYRMYFSGGSRELDGSSVSGTAGKMNLTETGEQIFLRAVEVAINNGLLPGDPTDVVGFVLHPAPTVNLVEGQTLSLSVSVTGAPPVSLQWYKDDVVISGATRATLTVSNVTLDASGTYHAVANNNVPSTATSGSAVVTVIADTFPPTVDRIVSHSNMTNITIHFSEPLLSGPVVDAWNYFFAPTEGGEQIGVHSAELLTPSTVLVTLAEPRAPGVQYSVSFEGFADLHGNMLDPTQRFVVPALVVFQEGFFGYGGTLDTDLRFGNPGADRGGEMVVLVDGLDAGGAVHGLLWFQNIFGTDPGQIPLGANILSATLRLHTQNGSVDSVRLHRMVIPWSESDTWNSFVNGINADGTQAAAVFDAAFVHNTVNTNVQVDVMASLQAWAAGASYYGWALLPTGNDGYSFTSSEGASENRPMLVVEFEVLTGGIEITQQPASVINVNEGATVSLNVTVSGPSPGFQWYKNNEPVPGATSASLLLQNTTAADSGAYHVVVSNEVNTVTSSTAQVTVNADLTAPVVVSAVGHWSLTDITIRFSKPIDPASVNLANITVRSETGTELVLQGFEVVNGTDLVLTTSPRQTDVNYTATLSGITDLAFARNEIAANTQIGLTLETRSRSILWVSDNGAENSFSPALVDAFDDAFVQLLQNAGYAVHRFNPPNSQNDLLTPDQLAAINTNGLVIVGRAIGSGAFQAPQGAQWNTQVAVPLICMSPYLVRQTDSRMGWFTGSTLVDGFNARLTAVNLEDPVTAYLFGTVEMDGTMTLHPYDIQVDRGTSHIVEPPVAGGTTRATAVAGAQTVQAIATFPAGTPVRSGSDILAAYRMFFAGGSREPDPPGGVSNAGKNNLTPTGEAIFLRAVELALNEGVVPDVPPSGPVMSIARDGDNVVISWTGAGFRLEETSEIGSGAWQPVAGGDTSPVTIPIGAGDRFFRLSDQ